MARLIQRQRNRPYVVTVSGETKYLCGCGLSANQPYCDGTHKITQTEDAGTLYWYDQGGQRHEAKETYPGMRDDRLTKDA